MFNQCKILINSVLLLNIDGSIWGCGNNTNGALGIGNKINQFITSIEEINMGQTISIMQIIGKNQLGDKKKAVEFLEKAENL